MISATSDLPPLTRIDVEMAVDRYVAGYIEIEEFERAVEAALRGPVRPDPLKKETL